MLGHEDSFHLFSSCLLSGRFGSQCAVAVAVAVAKVLLPLRFLISVAFRPSQFDSGMTWRGRHPMESQGIKDTLAAGSYWETEPL